MTKTALFSNEIDGSEANRMAAKKKPNQKGTLLRTAPPIWRRLLVPSDVTLSGLHDLLQLHGPDRLSPARVPISRAVLRPD